MLPRGRTPCRKCTESRPVREGRVTLRAKPGSSPSRCHRANPSPAWCPTRRSRDSHRRCSAAPMAGGRIRLASHQRGSRRGRREPDGDGLVLSHRNPALRLAAAHAELRVARGRRRSVRRRACRTRTCVADGSQSRRGASWHPRRIVNRIGRAADALPAQTSALTVRLGGVPLDLGSNPKRGRNVR